MFLPIFMSRQKTQNTCPCQSKLAYSHCCQVWHAPVENQPQGPDPEALMRSRYSAYVLDLTSYLLATWHPTTRPAELILEDFKWLGLRILRVETNAKSSVVEFIARYRQQGRAYRLHEVSRFVCQEGRWFYIDGQMQS